MRVIVEIEDTDITDAVNEVNDAKRQSGDVNKLRVGAVKAWLRSEKAAPLLAANVLDIAIAELA